MVFFSVDYSPSVPRGKVNLFYSGFSIITFLTILVPSANEIVTRYIPLEGFVRSTFVTETGFLYWALKISCPIIFVTLTNTISLSVLIVKVFSLTGTGYILIFELGVSLVKVF